MKQTKTTQYSCPEEILYTICLAAWAFCRRFLLDFKSFSAGYTDTLIDDAIKQVNEAKKLTAVQERNSERKRARIKLVKSAKLNLQNWQKLKRYIISIFPKDEVETYLTEAGASFYTKASATNWTSVRSLLDATKAFMTKYSSELDTKIPAPVSDKFKTDIADCFSLSDIYFTIDTEINLQTADKNKANNQIYQAVIAMLKDGQQIFKDNKELKKQFTFNYLLKTIKGSGMSGFKGYIGTADGLPLEGVTVTTSNQKYTATTGKDGRFHITRIEAGDYSFSISKEGYQAIVKSYTIKPGITKNVDLVLDNEVMLQVA